MCVKRGSERICLGIDLEITRFLAIAVNSSPAFMSTLEMASFTALATSWSLAGAHL